MRRRWLLSAYLLCTVAAAQQPTIKPVATIIQLHEAMISPASDAIFNAGQEPPKDEKAWLAVRNNALILAEAGNLLMLGGRAKDQGGWMKMSRAMVDAAATAAKAAEAKNVDAIMAAGDRIVSTCESCHQVYRDKGRRMMR
jgi:cytochrome c553